jgi:hypothetical protein
MRDRLPIILSSTALLVALFGATPLGEAAYNAVVPKNSVGAQQLRKGAVTNAKIRGDAVTSGKVKNRSLRAIDFAVGQLPAGPAGPPGSKGSKGEKGDIGPSDGYADVSTGPAAVPTVGADTRVATLRLPAAGKYLLWAKTWLNRPTAGQPTQFVCRLVAGTANDLAFGSAPTGLQQTLTNILAVDVTEATTVNLNCGGSGASTANSSTITAVKVGSLTTSTG